MELSGLYMKAGLKNVGIMFLMTDAQVPSEQFLVLINDLLASGEVPDLFPDDEVENIIASVRNEVSFQSLCKKSSFSKSTIKGLMMFCLVKLIVYKFRLRVLNLALFTKVFFINFTTCTLTKPAWTITYRFNVPAGSSTIQLIMYNDSVQVHFTFLNFK